MDLILNAEEVQRLIRDGLPAADEAAIVVEEVAPGRARVRFPFRQAMLRPGNRVSGPTLFAAVDTAMYAVVLAHVGAERMALTSDINLHFLRAAAPRDVIATATLLRLGRRVAVISVEAGADGEPPAVVATGSYMRPDKAVV